MLQPPFKLRLSNSAGTFPLLSTVRLIRVYRRQLSYATELRFELRLESSKLPCLPLADSVINFYALGLRFELRFDGSGPPCLPLAEPKI